MISNRRRIFIVIISVTIGSLLSAWIMQKRMGKLSQEDYMSLMFNFIFAAAIVVGLMIFLGRMNRNDQSGNGPDRP
jgi:hypothetical protein